MATYEQSSEILSGTEADYTELIEALESELPKKFYVNGHTSTQTSSAGAFTKLHGVTSVVIADDEVIKTTSTLSVSGSNTSDSWQCRHVIGANVPSVRHYSRWSAASSSTGGNKDNITVSTIWENITGGTYEVELQVATVSGAAPTGTFYSNVGNTIVEICKKR